MKIVFLGSGTFAKPILEALQVNVSVKFEVDKDNPPDLIVVVNYGKLINKEMLALPKYGAVNIHPSLLPELRGPSPIQYALREGRDKTGVSLMVMDEEFDHGPIISQEKISINKNDTYNTLEPRLAKLGSTMLLRDLLRYVSGELIPQAQDHKKATTTKKVKKEDGRVDWGISARQIYNMWRAYVRWPGIFTTTDDARLNLVEVLPGVASDKKEPGTIFVKDKGLFIRCGDGAIEVIKIQPEGKNVMDAKSFLNGYSKFLDKKAGGLKDPPK